MESELTVRVPVRLPVCLGLKTTPVEQEPPAASVDPQVFSTTANGAEATTARAEAATLPELVIVTPFAVLVWPRAVAEDVRVAGSAFNPEAD